MVLYKDIKTIINFLCETYIQGYRFCAFFPSIEEKKGYTLSNRKYFNGKQAMSEWQDKYSKAMEPYGLSKNVPFGVLNVKK